MSPRTREVSHETPQKFIRESRLGRRKAERLEVRVSKELVLAWREHCGIHFDPSCVSRQDLG